MNTSTITKLRKLHACGEAVEWAETQPSFAAAWRNCQRGGWMLWLLTHTGCKQGSPKHRKIVLSACDCARLALDKVPDGDDRPRIAIETAESWAQGNGATLDQVKSAADAACTAYAAADAAYAAYAADAAYAAYAADAAAYAAYAADAAGAAYAAADAAYAAADAAADAADAYAAADYAAAGAARRNTQAKCANIVRKRFPNPPIIWGNIT